jgi:hypothetical protein
VSGLVAPHPSPLSRTVAPPLPPSAGAAEGAPEGAGAAGVAPGSLDGATVGTAGSYRVSPIRAVGRPPERIPTTKTIATR